MRIYPTGGIVCGILLITVLAQVASAQYPGWQHEGSMFVLTTPEGANLPATALEHDFPLLVRLRKDFFDFSQAKGNGEDIRFSSEIRPLAYQVEEWDAAKGVASIWVRVPVIQGNARQEIKMHWGKPDAPSESNGAAVFNEGNGYLSVWHMNEPVKDEAGTPASTDKDTTPVPGMIGPARIGRTAGPRRAVLCGAGQGEGFWHVSGKGFCAESSRIVTSVITHRSA